jgi:hypothetical protein
VTAVPDGPNCVPVTVTVCAALVLKMLPAVAAAERMGAM